jgi:hypothetical protein
MNNGGAEDRNEGSQGRRGAKHQRLSENDDDVSSEDSTEVLAVQNIRFQEPKALDPNQVTLCRRLVNITLSKLMGEDTKQSNRTYIDVQLLRIISPINVPGSSGSVAFTYASSRNKNRNSGNQANYTRLFLVRVFSENESSKLAYLMEARNQNKQLWNSNLEWRDNGVISIGTIFRILGPRPIDNVMSGDVPMLQSDFPAVIMKPPKLFVPVNIDPMIQGNTALAFTINNVELSVSGFTPVSTSCSGLFCDRQRISEWNGSERGCGCYSVLHRRSSIAFQHDIEATLPNGFKISMEKFSSNAFTKLFMSENLSPSILLQRLQMTDEMFDIEDHLEDIIAHINNNEGFTIVGWYKRGVINDKSLVAARGNGSNANNDSGIQVDNGDVNFHITTIMPTDRNLLDIGTAKGRILRDMKYDVSQLH